MEQTHSLPMPLQRRSASRRLSLVRLDGGVVGDPHPEPRTEAKPRSRLHSLSRLTRPSKRGKKNKTNTKTAKIANPSKSATSKKLPTPRKQSKKEKKARQKRGEIASQAATVFNWSNVQVPRPHTKQTQDRNTSSVGGESDKVRLLTQEVGELREICIQDLDRVFDRGEHVQRLDDVADTLLDESESFRSRTGALHSELRWGKYRCYLILCIAVTAFCISIGLATTTLICGDPLCSRLYEHNSTRPQHPRPPPAVQPPTPPPPVQPPTPPPTSTSTSSSTATSTSGPTPTPTSRVAEPDLTHIPTHVATTPPRAPTIATFNTSRP